MAQPTRKKAQSIEDLLKKPEDAAAAPTPGYIAGAATPVKAAAKKAARPEEMTEAERLEHKLSEVKLRELERTTQARATKLGLPYIDLQGFPIAPEALTLLPREEAARLRTILFLKSGDELRIGTASPGPEVDALAKRLATEQVVNVQIYLISDQSLKTALKLYEALPEIKEIIFGVRIEEEALQRFEKEIGSFRDLQEKISKVSTTDIVTLMLGAALKSGASDIHVEAEEEDVKLRFRIDGILQDAAKLPRDTWKQMISRLKLLAGAKINVEGVPQDGRITIYLAAEKIDIRVSFLPTAYGESVVMRILRPKAIALEFDNLGVRGLAWDQLKREIERPNGMIVTTGPTGSGKTTTLYAILKKLNTPDVKIITLEDPIEYKLVGINQSQIDHEKKYDFARGLRAILRQDPDVVMVGEIRDLETAEIAIQAALTGHLVVSTIHTNSAAGAIPRFLSMGVKPFLLAPAINAIIGQRLVRRLCEKCKQKMTLEPAVLKEVQGVLSAIPKNSGYAVDLKKLQFFGPPEGKNTCTACNGLGYKGRVGVYEIMTMSKEIENVILSGNVSEYQMAELAMKQGMITMAQDGLLKALDGMTSVEEVLRVAEIEAVMEDVPET
ncbi:type II/IV secretion system protein [Candidatus Uhrbacteria bacterium]|nr:type II/IV secretion system protein [Candidatus Uhrbacteria bacterium]